MIHTTQPQDDSALVSIPELGSSGFARYESLLAYPRAKVAANRITEHRPNLDFSGLAAVPPIILSECELVDAYPDKRKGSFWWVWGQQFQRDLPEGTGLPDRTDAQWWPLSHFHWRCHAVDRSSYNLTVEMGEWEAVETVGTMTEYISSSEAVVELDDGHALTSGTYAVYIRNGIRRSVTCTVTGNSVAISGGSGQSFYASSVGYPVTFYHYDSSEADGNHCLKPGMLLRAWLAQPGVEQPQYLSSPTQTVTVEAVSGSEVQLSNVRFSTIWRNYARPTTDNSLEHVHYGDLVYLRLLDPPRQKCTIATRTSNTEGVLSFPGGHNFTVGDTVRFSEESPIYYSGVVTGISDTTVTIGDYLTVGGAFPTVGSTRHATPGWGWPGYQIIYGEKPPINTPTYSEAVPPPESEGIHGQLMTTERVPVQAVRGREIVCQVDMDRADGFELEFTLSREDEDTPFPLALGETFEIWLDDAYYVEIKRVLDDGDEAWRSFEFSVRTASCTSLSTLYRPMSVTPLTITTFGIGVRPAYHRDGWVLYPIVPGYPYGSATLPSTYIDGTIEGRVTLMHNIANLIDVIQLSNVVLYGPQDALTYTEKNGNIGTFSAGTKYMPLMPGPWVALRLFSDTTSYVSYPGTIIGDVFKRVHGVLLTRDSDSAGTLDLTANRLGHNTVNELGDGEYEVNLRWGDALLGYGRDGVTAAIDGDVLTFSGGDGDPMAALYLETAGSLSARWSDTYARLNKGTSSGVIGNSYAARVTWTIEGVEYARTGVEVAVYTTYTNLSGGDGDAYPAVNTAVVLYQIHRSVHAIRPVATWTPEWGGELQVDFIWEPPEPGEVVRVNQASGDLYGGSLQYQSPPLHDVTWPWAMRVAASGTLADGEYVVESNYLDQPTGDRLGQYYLDERPDGPKIDVSFSWYAGDAYPALRDLGVKIHWHYEYRVKGSFTEKGGEPPAGVTNTLSVPESVLDDGSYAMELHWTEGGEAKSGSVSMSVTGTVYKYNATLYSGDTPTPDIGVEMTILYNEYFYHYQTYEILEDCKPFVLTSENDKLHGYTFDRVVPIGGQFTIECIDHEP